MTESLFITPSVLPLPQGEGLHTAGDHTSASPLQIRGGRGSYGSQRGVTLIELMIVLAIAAILMVAAGFEYSGWKGRYNVEKTIKDLYSSLTDARTRAMQTNRAHFFDISPDGMYYRVSDDNSDGVATVADGDGIFQQQATWAAIAASSPINWGAVAATTDDTVVTLSRKIELSNKVATAAGLLSARNVTQGTYGFALGFDKRGMIRNMRGTPPGTPPVTNIQNATAFPTTNGGGLSICIFTDYNNDTVSDYNPDYDCINIVDTKIYLGKLTTQNTAGGTCDAANCISK